jgi:hypothetical protein
MKYTKKGKIDVKKQEKRDRTFEKYKKQQNKLSASKRGLKHY